MRSGALVVLLFGVAGAVGCGSHAPDPGPSACSDADAYEFDVVDDFEAAVRLTPFWYGQDATPGGTASAAVEPIPEGDRCGSLTAQVFRSSGHRDWGVVFGYNNFGIRDETAFEGVSFWARASADGSKGFTILMDDPNTNQDPFGPSNCTFPATSIDPTTGQPIPSTAPPMPGDCGNSYTVGVTVTSSWRLYTIPFARFQQAALPNRVPNSVLTQTGPVPGTALLTNALKSFLLRIPKYDKLELWIDDLSFYRGKAL